MTEKAKDVELEVLNALLKDPTMSLRDISKSLNSYRQKIWRIKTRLEESEIIWGYTAVVDEVRMGHVLYMIMLRMKPMNEDLVRILIRRITKLLQPEQDVRLIDVLYINGEYDWLIKFSAPNHTIARRYYDSIRIDYDEYLLGKPLIVDMNFILVTSGKMNPDLHKLYDFVPSKTL